MEAGGKYRKAKRKGSGREGHRVGENFHLLLNKNPSSFFCRCVGRSAEKLVGGDGSETESGNKTLNKLAEVNML